MRNVVTGSVSAIPDVSDGLSLATALRQRVG